MKVQGGEIQLLEAGTMDHADHTFVYPAPGLLSSLRNRYPNLDADATVTIIQPHQLALWLEALNKLR